MILVAISPLPHFSAEATQGHLNNLTLKEGKMETNSINGLSLQTRGLVSQLSKLSSNLAGTTTKTGQSKARTTKGTTSLANKTTSSSNTKKAANADASKVASLAQKVKDATTSSSSILDKFKGQIPTEDYTRLQLQQALEQRSQMISLVTNLMQTMHEMAMSVIRNFRVS